MSSISFKPGAVKGGVLPFELGSKRSSDVSELAKLLGHTFEVQTENYGPSTVQLVQLNQASGATSPGEKIFVRTTVGGADFDVDVAGASTGLFVHGVAVPNQETLVDNDYFFLVIDGYASFLNDSAGQIDASDNFSSSGAVAGSVVEADTTITPRVTIGICLETVAASTAFVGRFYHRLQG